MLKQLLQYAKKRLDGSIEAPAEVQTVESAAKKARLAAEAKKEAEDKKLEEDWAKEDDLWANWKGGADQDRKRWDDDESDPEELCPDKAKHGSCSYGRQCAFCFR
mmetsp:Transcript_25401/g.50854  ORF Transcript_25401/g.50854 Transcript_25401/m.50854 type:complete len:105 (+) Transcript_25401:391-705(+)